MKRPGTLLLKRITLLPERVPSYDEFPYDIPFVRDLSLTFRKPVTCFVGENGSGKSTLIEAIAEASGLPIWGGSRNEAANRHGPDHRAAPAGRLFLPRRIAGELRLIARRAATRPRLRGRSV